MPRLDAAMIKRQSMVHDQGLMDAGARFAAQPISWRARCALARRAGKRLWTSICASLAARRRRRVAAVVYAGLSKLSDAELQWRGLSRADLNRLASERDDRQAE
jgi:hypothetical protein